MTSGSKVVGYVRVSTEDQADSGAGLQAQREAIEAHCKVHGWTLVSIFEDAGESGGKPWTDRPALTEAVAFVESKQADGIIAAKLDRISRSLLDFATLIERSRKKHWSLSAIDMGLDTATPHGEMLAGVLAVFAQFERRLIGQRTKDALAAKKAAGVKLGRRSVLPAEVVDRIRAERAAEHSLTAIANGLNADAVPTGQGGKRWYPSTVRAVILSQDAASVAA